MKVMEVLKKERRDAHSLFFIFICQ